MDHCEKEKRKVNPRETANIFSLVTFSYILGLFKKASKHDLEEDDLYEALEKCNSKRCGDKFEEQWKSLTKTNKQPNILRTVWRSYGWRYLVMGSTYITWMIIRIILEPYAMSELIAYFRPGQRELSKFDAYYFGAMMIFLHLFHRFFIHNYMMLMDQLGLEIKTTFSSLLYRKALKLTPTAMSEITLGNIVTLITKDVQIFKDSIWIINDVSSAIIQTCVISYLIFAKVGPVSFFGIGVLIASMPIQVLIGRWITKLRNETGQRTDERLQVIQETLSTIRMIKMYTWEKFFRDKINYARRKEVNKILLGLYLRTLLIIVGVLFSNLGFYVLLLAYVWMGFSTDTTVVFYLLSNFKGLKSALGSEIPWSIGKFAELLSAATRINNVIQAEELHPPQKVNIAQVDHPSVVRLNAASVHIGNKEILSNVSLEIGAGLTIVTGCVGSGKSSLLKSILQDYPLTSGEVLTSGDISYASQDPWLFPSSIKQNILFGQEFHEKRYQDVIRVCALQYDFNLLHDGHETIVTDRGLNLSKGQQARVNLARAIYKDSEIYLLDDPLSALDAHVNDYIFEECIKTYLKGKICILVSHSANHIDEADNVVIMDKGRVKHIGKPIGEILEQVKEITVKDDDLEKKVIDEDDEVESDEKQKLLEREQVSKRKIYKEVKREGKIDISVYKKYIIFGGGFILLTVNVILGILAQTSESYSDKLLTQWVDEKQNVLNLKQGLDINNTHPSSSLSDAEAKEQSTFRLYSIMLVSTTASSLLVIYANFDFFRRASTNIHKAMVGSIVEAVMPFFDSHFIGNVLNRFSQDMAQIDESIPFILREVLRVLFSTVGHISLVLSVDSNFIMFISIVMIVLLVINKMYLPVGRSLKRLEASTRSPMIGHLNASLEGLTTIRAYKAENILTEEFDRHQDLYTSAFYTSICSMRAFCFYMDCVGSILFVAVVAKFLFLENGESAGNVGLALTQVSILGGVIQWGLRQWSEMENHMTSVERVLEYTEIESEEKEGQISEDWPSQGVIEYDDVSLAYNSESVLKHLSFKAESKQRIGIVGRTGAGKSSLISSIFRLYDVQGRILIDGVDIKTLFLKFLREKLAIIPQDPVLFRGTVRSNLDPFREFGDEDLWTALEKVNLKNAVTNLDMEISTGTSFSSGEKQLFCVARALLRKSKILILDEATANMDNGTDVMLHNVISQNFVDCTTLIVAHRLHSILECDKVIVFDKGEIKEFDEPSNLLGNENGLFHKMVRQAGLLNYFSERRYNMFHT